MLYMIEIITLICCRQLPTEWKLFGQVDKAWKDIMRRTEDRPNALRSATAPGVLEMLQSANSNLEKIQKCLEVRGMAIEMTITIYTYAVTITR